MRSQIITGAINGTSFFPEFIAMDSIYEFHLKSGGNLTSTSQGIFLPEQPFIIIGQSSGFCLMKVEWC